MIVQEEEEGGQPGVQEYHIQSGLLCPTKYTGIDIFNIYSSQTELRNSLIDLFLNPLKFSPKSRFHLQ